MAGRYVSRAGEKLQAALEAFGIDASGKVAADFGCNVGGFTQCLLDGGAARVYAIDTGYGQLAWKLRKDPRVVVMERTNALYASIPEPVSIVTIDMAWTVQALSVPAAMRWLEPGGNIVSLLKPHYEAAKMPRRATEGLSLTMARDICLTVCRSLEEACPCEMQAIMESPLKGKGGNPEFVLWLRPRKSSLQQLTSGPS